MNIRSSKSRYAIVPAAVLAFGAIFSASAAGAQGDLYFMHNASPYFVWSDLSVCESNLSGSGNPCVSWGSTPFCGRHLWATPATTRVAGDRLNSNRNLTIRHTNGNSEFCDLTP